MQPAAMRFLPGDLKRFRLLEIGPTLLQKRTVDDLSGPQINLRGSRLLKRAQLANFAIAVITELGISRRMATMRTAEEVRFKWLHVRREPKTPRVEHIEISIPASS